MASYYDLDAILTDSQKVPCTFDIDVPGLGYLQGNPGTDVKAGTKVEIPLWLGEMLAVSQSSTGSRTVTLGFPDSLSQKVLNALKADPRTVELRALAPHFYSLGARVLEIFLDDDLPDILSETFKKRAKEIADQANNTRGSIGESADFLQGLDEDERQLFRKAHDSAKSVRVWMTELQKS